MHILILMFINRIPCYYFGSNFGSQHRCFDVREQTSKVSKIDR